ncbi:hypothetical protein BDF14DRAFT_1801869 [Spinellus fusiger]|nr:hypothetical protein BDF14DRAFT_1801869 [Spinellus fusiger]
MVKSVLVSIFAFVSLAAAAANSWPLEFKTPTSKTVWEFGKNQTVEWQFPEGQVIADGAATYLFLHYDHPKEPEGRAFWAVAKDFDINKGSIEITTPAYFTGQKGFNLEIFVDDHSHGRKKEKSDLFTIIQ